jgi:DedD protein
MGLLSFGRHKDDAAGDDSASSTASGQDAAGARSKSRRKTRAADPIDPVLPEKQRARRRLVGAVALVLAAVIGLPMILDPEPKPLASDISVEIPSKDKAKPTASAPAMAPAAAALDQREEIVNPDAPAKAAAPGTPTSAAGLAAATPAAAALPKADAAKPDTSKPDTSKPDIGKAEANKADNKTDVRAESKPAQKAEPKADTQKADIQKAEAPKVDDARARAILDGREAAAKHEPYMVQVAALASADKVHELQNKLKAAGIKSQTQKVATQSGERIRVRIGPLQGRAEAEKMRTRLNKLGLNGTLVPA